MIKFYSTISSNKKKPYPIRKGPFVEPVRRIKREQNELEFPPLIRAKAHESRPDKAQEPDETIEESTMTIMMMKTVGKGTKTAVCIQSRWVSAIRAGNGGGRG